MNSGPKPTDPQSGLSPRQISLASLLVALAAFVVGALGYALANSVQEEQQELIVHAAAATNPRYDLLAGQGVNLSISNESLRAIIVDRIDLSVDGERLTSAETYLPDARLLEQHALAPDRLATEAQPLPVTVDSRSAKTISIFFSIARTVGGNTTDEEVSSYKRALRVCRAITYGLLLKPPKDLAKLSLTIHYLPDGSTTIPLDSRGSMDEHFDWFSSVEGPAQAPTAMLVWRKLTEPQAVREISFKLWGQETREPYVSHAALFGSNSTKIPLPALTPGRYSFAIFDHGHGVDGGRFSVPLRGPKDREAFLPGSGFDRPACVRLREHPGDFLTVYALKRLGIPKTEWFSP